VEAWCAASGRAQQGNPSPPAPADRFAFGSQ
jgi:hypothetical protein